MKSLFSQEKKCYVCGRTPVHKHHIYMGANRKISEAQGCWVYLCPQHHNMSNQGVHFNKELDDRLKRECQLLWERNGSRAEWMRLFGKNYIGDDDEERELYCDSRMDEDRAWP